MANQPWGDHLVGNVSGAWRLGAIADMNGDKSPDLVWQNLTTGSVCIWPMQTYNHVGPDTCWQGNVTSPWTLSGAADFTGDGKPDLLWHDVVNGDVIVWPMNGVTHTGPDRLIGNRPSGWIIGAVADFTATVSPTSFQWRQWRDERDTWIWPSRSRAVYRNT